MSKKIAISSLVSAAVLASSLGMNAHAADNPFGHAQVGTLQVAGMEGKCGEGKCGEGMKKDADTKKEETDSRSGEGKCGSGSMSDHETPPAEMQDGSSSSH